MMSVTITVEHLRKANACSQAIEIFRSIYGDSATEEWTRDKQIELLKGPLGKHLWFAFDAGLLPRWSMRLADLRWANLSSADLRLANLSSADLRWANLSLADLSLADLRLADLRSANLSSADLRSANLRSADLRSADLRSANLSSADLRLAYRPDNPPKGWRVDGKGRLEKDSG